MKKLVIRVITIVVVALVLVYGGILLWTKVLNKPDDALDSADLSQTLETVPVATDSATANPEGGDDITGMWQATSESTLGYRVKEVLGGVDTEGVGRTSTLTGSLTFEGRVLIGANFSVDVASITSDSGKRDEKFAGEIMETATYPDATFRLTSPVDIAEVPADGTQVEITVEGELTMHGVANTVTFPLTAEYTNGRIGVLGNIEVAFADYGIDNPSNGFVTTGDTGLIEFVLVFERV